MADVLEKCTVCHGLIDEEDLFCSNCGTEAPHKSKEKTKHLAQVSFACEGCGASMSYDPKVQSLRCPFCGSNDVTKTESHQELLPDGVIPFEVEQNKALQVLRQWMGTGFFRPRDLVKLSQIQYMSPIYVPYWVFRATTKTYWTGDSSVTPSGARGDWYPHFGEHESVYRGVLVGASSALTPKETNSVGPFRLDKAVAIEEIDITNHTSEQFRVTRKMARPYARSRIEELERRECAKKIPGSSRNVKVNTRIANMSSRPLLIPFWICAYRYKGELYRFVMNGQTGKFTGKAPTDYLKVALIVIGAMAAFLMLFICMGIMSSL